MRTDSLSTGLLLQYWTCGSASKIPYRVYLTWILIHQSTTTWLFGLTEFRFKSGSEKQVKRKGGAYETAGMFLSATTNLCISISIDIMWVVGVETEMHFTQIIR
jgi:hypothetical protein